MVKMSGINLTDEQKLELAHLSQSPAELVRRRVRLILAYADGLPTMQAAKLAGISRGRARYWKRRFLSAGMGIFEQLHGDQIEHVNAPESALPVQDDNLVYEKTHNEAAGASTQMQYPQPQKKIRMLIGDSLAEAGKKVWLYHFAIMLSHEQGTLLGEDIEELHDMRVATRRMRSAFDIFGRAFEPKTMKHYLKGLKKTGSALGEVRDMDVILDNALLYQAELAENESMGLEPLFTSWRQIIGKKRIKLSKHLESKAYQKFKFEFNNFLQEPENMPTSAVGFDASSRIRDLVPVLFYSRYAAVRAYDSILPTASIEQLHALRIEFKKFRYALEYFREILGDSSGKAINEIKNYQDHLGKLHDADVACQLVSGYLKRWDGTLDQSLIQDRFNPEPIVRYLAYLHAERYRLMVEFPGLWQQFNRSEFRQNLAQAISRL